MGMVPVRMKTFDLNPGHLPFDLDKTLDCGQVFRWEKEGDEWRGIVNGSLVSVRQKEACLIYDGITEDDLIAYFNLNLDLAGVITSIRDTISSGNPCGRDTLFENVFQAGNGLRIIRQDPWECLISFICSQNSNIPAIKKRISLLCSSFGRAGSGGYHHFPSPEIIAQADLSAICSCKTGYRASYISETARRIRDEPDFLSPVRITGEHGREQLMSLPGVGPKVADCVLLFAYNYYQVVPVDVWIRSIITRYYPRDDPEGSTNRKRTYEDISSFCQNYFGSYAGYAQQLLFAARSELTDTGKEPDPKET